ncbi:MAG: DUF1003 domain-containing protein [Halioglobus sp.]
MAHGIKDVASRYLQTAYDDLAEREKLIIGRMAKRVAISRNINEQFHENLTLGQRLADKVAAFGGSWRFILLFLATLVAWVVLNTLALPATEAFDPYPFIFLNLILSMLAAIQAPIIMMSQNRQTSKDRLAQSNDYQVNLKSELEIMNLHEKIDQLRIGELEKLLLQQAEAIGRMQRALESLNPQSQPGT